MDDNEFDLEKFVDLFDTAMTSDNPTVKKAFKNLMLVAAIVNDEDENQLRPLRHIVEKMKDIDKRITNIEYKNGVYGVAGISGTSGTTWGATWTVSPNSTSIYANTQAPTASTSNYMATSNYDLLYNHLENKTR